MSVIMRGLSSSVTYEGAAGLVVRVVRGFLHGEDAGEARIGAFQHGAPFASGAGQEQGGKRVAQGRAVVRGLDPQAVEHLRPELHLGERDRDVAAIGTRVHVVDRRSAVWPVGAALRCVHAGRVQPVEHGHQRRRRSRRRCGAPWCGCSAGRCRRAGQRAGCGNADHVTPEHREASVPCASIRAWRYRGSLDCGSMPRRRRHGCNQAETVFAARSTARPLFRATTPRSGTRERNATTPSSCSHSSVTIVSPG